MIEYLKKNKFGRATFLPLTSVGQNNSSFNQEKALKEPGVIGLASTLVQAEKQYEGLIRYLLGKVVVVDQHRPCDRVGQKVPVHLKDCYSRWRATERRRFHDRRCL